MLQSPRNNKDAGMSSLAWNAWGDKAHLNLHANEQVDRMTRARMSVRLSNDLILSCDNLMYHPDTSALYDANGVITLATGVNSFNLSGQGRAVLIRKLVIAGVFAEMSLCTLKFGATAQSSKMQLGGAQFYPVAAFHPTSFHTPRFELIIGESDKGDFSIYNGNGASVKCTLGFEVD